VKRDAKSAEALLEAADKLWHGRGASFVFAAITSQIHPRQRNDFAMRRLGMAAEAGNADAEVMKVVAELLADDTRVLTAQQIELLERPSSNDIGLGYSLLAEHYEKRGMTAQRDAAWRKAADRGHSIAQRVRAWTAIREGGAKLPRDVWWTDMTAAAQGGDFLAMRYLSKQAVVAKDWNAAAAWLLAAVRAGDLDAFYDITALYETGNADLPGGLDDAIEAYQTLSTDTGENGAMARRRLAALAIEGRGMKRDPKRALEWLQIDAVRGDATSQAMLGSLLLRKDVGLKDVDAGQRWLQKAIDAGLDGARTDLALWLHNDAGTTQERRARAVRMLREVGESSDHIDIVLNNLAWMLCVSPHEDTRDPPAGLAVAKRMQQRGGLDPGDIDTVAACYAATGDFAAAAKLQSEAIDALPRDEKGKPQGGQGMFDRLDLFRAGKAYLDPPG
jgi:TPR repeat protein